MALVTVPPPIKQIITLAQRAHGRRYTRAPQFEGTVPPRDGVFGAEMRNAKGPVQKLHVRRGADIVEVEFFPPGFDQDYSLIVWHLRSNELRLMLCVYTNGLVDVSLSGTGGCTPLDAVPPERLVPVRTALGPLAA